MNDRELIKKLKSLRSVAANQSWLEKQEGVLRSQIYSGAAEVEELGFWGKMNLITIRMSQPYAMAALVVLFFVASGGASYFASQNSKPGEPLYIAKQLSEKTKMAFTFNEKSKTRLTVEFAKERINELAAMSSAGNKSQMVTVKQEVAKDIASAKERLARFSPRPVVIAVKPVAKVVAKATSTKVIAKKPAEDKLKAAAASKSGQRIDISLPDINTTLKITDPHQALDKAQELMDKDDYQGAKAVLDQANELIEKGK